MGFPLVNSVPFWLPILTLGWYDLGVLYHPSSGWIYLAPGQNPSLGWWHDSIYVAQSSMTYGISALIHCCLLFIQPFYFHPDLLLSKLTTRRQEHPWLIPRRLDYHPGLVASAWPVPLITVEEMWRMWWKRETIRTLKQTRCHLWKIVFKEMIQFGLIYPPFWFSMLESKRLCSYYWKENIKDHYLRKLHHIFQTLIHNFHTEFLSL